MFFVCSSQSKIYRRAKPRFSAFIPSPHPLLLNSVQLSHNLRSGSIFIWKLLKLGLVSGNFSAAVYTLRTANEKHTKKTACYSGYWNYSWSKRLLCYVFYNENNWWKVQKVVYEYISTPCWIPRIISYERMGFTVKGNITENYSRYTLSLRFSWVNKWEGAHQNGFWIWAYYSEANSLLKMSTLFFKCNKNCRI